MTMLDRSGSRLHYSTFVGGSSFDGAHDGWLDDDGTFYIDGLTS